MAILLVSLVVSLPLVLAVDGILGDTRLFYAISISVFNPYDTFLQALGLVILLSSLLIQVWAGSYLVRYVYGKPPDQRSLLKAGPYRYVRHPFYLGFILFGIGMLLISLNILILTTLGYLIYLAYAYRAEDESDLLEKYGKDYQEYMESTGGFLPKRNQSRTNRS